MLYAIQNGRTSVEEELYVDKEDRVDDLLGVGCRVEKAHQAASQGGGGAGGHQGLHLFSQRGLKLKTNVSDTNASEKFTSAQH